MALSPENVNHLYMAALLDEFARADVRHACVAPGSRSAPLAMSLAADARFKIWMHYDERCAAFFALGLAKVTRHPVLLVCTSGTAAANFYPAIIEAHYAGVPLIVLTADRPPELREVGAPQTIDQLKLYGAYPKWFAELPLPEATPDLLRFARTLASRAITAALTPPAGVVHLNCPFREPLIPVPPEGEWQMADGKWRIADSEWPSTAKEAIVGRPAEQTYTTAYLGQTCIDDRTLQNLGPWPEHGLIVAGPQTDPALPTALAELSRALGYPLLADPLSQARCGTHDLANVVEAYDAFLRDAGWVKALAPEVVLRFGALPTSKPLWQYLQAQPQAQQIVVTEAAPWPDMLRLASTVVQADPTRFCQQLSTQLASMQRPVTSWLTQWRDLNARARRVITQKTEEPVEFFEGRVFTELAALMPAQATLFVSSSMPVRDLDTFFASQPRALRFYANRGANGIDGVVSSALGASVAAAPLVLVIGDLAFYHDLNGLLAAKLHGLNATIIVVNNDGGGIFSFLPQAAYPAHFEQLFGTPHGLQFKAAAELYSLAYQAPTTWPEFRAAVQHSFSTPGVSLIEIRTARQSNVTFHRAIWPAVTAALKPVA